MYGFPRTRKAQTAVEMLFIMGVILAGIVLVIPTYTQESSDSLMIYAIRSSATDAASYISLGVVTGKEPRYDPLDWIIREYTDYRSIKFRLVGIKLESEDETEIIVALEFEHELPLSTKDNKRIINKIGEFLKRSLSEKKGFEKDEDNNILYYHGKIVKFKLTVNGVTKVIS